MGNVQQTGSVSPGHQAVWTTDCILQDGGPLAGSAKVLGSIRGANFYTTTDQPLLITPGISAFSLSKIIVTNASISLSTAAGGFYTAVSKGGSVMVLAAQVYSALTGPDLLMNPSLTAFTTTARFSTDNLPLALNANNAYSLAFYFSLTTAQGVPATADIYAIGDDLSL